MLCLAFRSNVLYVCVCVFLFVFQDTRFDWANDDNGTWALNTFLVFALLGVLIIVHILLVSYLEASWLAQVGGVRVLWIVLSLVEGQQHQLVRAYVASVG